MLLEKNTLYLYVKPYRSQLKENLGNFTFQLLFIIFYSIYTHVSSKVFFMIHKSNTVYTVILLGFRQASNRKKMVKV